MNADTDRLSPADLSRRDTVVRLGAGSLAALPMATSRSSSAIADDASPVASPVAVGITRQAMGGGEPTAAPGLELSLHRTTITPGGRLPPHSHPAALVIFVDAGAFGYTTLGGTAQLPRASVAGTPVPAKEMPVGSEVILNPGDWLYVEEPSDDIRNAGEDDVILIVAGIAPIGEPGTTFL